ncbi:MAG: DUF2271 domain-containing protein [Zoogloea sp.]|nr:DUF2271 domain-containing protein [Zoogloea sp.]
MKPKIRYSLVMGVPLLSAPVLAADLAVKLDLPQLNVAEYHRPYVALWLERPDQSFAANLAVLYDQKKKDNGGTKWLKDLRQWWRKSGRELQMPVDGVTGATRAPGEHTLAFSGARAPLDKLPAGEYQLVVEAARESGGRELVRIPFQWPAKSAQLLSAKGREELGSVVLQLKP